MKSINKKITLLLIALIAISSVIIAQAQIVNGCTISNPYTANLSTDNAFAGQIAHYTLIINNTGSANIISSNFTIPKGYSNLESSSIKVTNNAGQTWTASIVTPPTLTSNGTIVLQTSVGGLSFNKTVTTTFTITNPSTANSYQWITKANLNNVFDTHNSEIYTIFLNQLITANPTPTPTPSPTATPSPTPSPTSSPSPTTTPPPTPDSTPSPTATPTPTLNPDPTQSPTSTPSPTSAPTPTPIVTPNPTDSATPTPSPTATPIPTPTSDSNPTTSPTPTPNPTDTQTSTETPSTPTPTQTTTQTTTTTTSSSSNSFTITFQQQGLPSGKSWNVTFNGVTKSTTTATIIFTGIKAGNYQWSTSRIINENGNTRYEANTATSGSIKVSSASVQTITYSTQYYLTVDSKYGNPTGEGWCTANTKATFAITTSTTQDLGTQYAFSGWTGTGTGSYSGFDEQSTITMVGPITETAKWEPASSLYSVLLISVVILVMLLLATFLALKRRKKKQKDD